MSAIPTASSDPSKAVIGKKSFLRYTPPGVSPVAVDFFGRSVGYNPTLDLLSLKMPDANGDLRKFYTDSKGGDESIKWETQEVKKVITLFAGKINRVLQGTAELWIKDPRDATGKTAIRITQFACALYLDNGEQKFIGDNETKFTLVIENTSGEPLEKTIDADSTDAEEG